MNRGSLLALCLLVAGTANATESEKGPYSGTFEQPPVPHFRIPLPGGILNSAAHTERGRPVIHGDRILVGSAAGEALYMLERGSGALVRTFPANASVQSEPLVVGDRVYFSDTSGRTWCYRLDGVEIWRHDTAAPILVGPTLHEGRIYVTSVDDLVLALDATTGALVWRHQQKTDVTRRAELALYAAPRALILEDTVLVGFSDGSLVALDAADGDVAWQTWIGEGRYPDLVAEPMPFQDLVITSGYFEPLVAVEAGTRRTVWEAPYGSAARPLLVGEGEDALLVHPGTDGNLRAFRARSGAEVWTWESGGSGALTEPTATDAGILVASSTGTVTLVDRDTGRSRWTFEPPFVLEGVTAAPTVDGRQVVFVSNAGFLYSLVSPQETRPWPRVPTKRKPKRVRGKHAAPKADPAAQDAPPTAGPPEDADVE